MSKQCNTDDDKRKVAIDATLAYLAACDAEDAAWNTAEAAAAEIGLAVRDVRAIIKEEAAK